MFDSFRFLNESNLSLCAGLLIWNLWNCFKFYWYFLFIEQKYYWFNYTQWIIYSWYYSWKNLFCYKKKKKKEDYKLLEKFTKSPKGEVGRRGDCYLFELFIRCNSYGRLFLWWFICFIYVQHKICCFFFAFFYEL